MFCRKNSITTEDQNHVTAAKVPETRDNGDAAPRPELLEPATHGVNGVNSSETPTPTTPVPPDAGGRGGPPPHHPNGWGSYGPPNGPNYSSQDKIREVREVQPEPQENVVLRRGFVPRTAPERMAQRKSSMTQLQQWVNQRRGMTVQEDPRR